MSQFLGEAVHSGVRTVAKVVFGAVFAVPFFGGGALALFGFYTGNTLMGVLGLLLVMGILALAGLFAGVLAR